MRKWCCKRIPHGLCLERSKADCRCWRVHFKRERVQRQAEESFDCQREERSCPNQVDSHILSNADPSCNRCEAGQVKNSTSSKNPKVHEQPSYRYMSTGCVHWI